MKIILFRFESEKIHLLECNINSNELTIWDKNKISIENINNRWNKYSEILEIFKNLETKYSPDYFAYQSPMKYRWAIKDEEWYVNSSLLHLFCETSDSNIMELTSPIVRDKLWLSAKDLKEELENEKNNILENYKIAKSDKLLDWFIYLSVIKSRI
jgi:hypothetical protein